MEINNLAREYNNFVEKRSTLTGEEAVYEARKLLQAIRDAGRDVSDPQQREILSAWARDLGDTIYENTGEYPPVRIVPLEVTETTPTTSSPPQQPQEITPATGPSTSALLWVLILTILIALIAIAVTQGLRLRRPPTYTFAYYSDLYLFSIQATYPKEPTPKLFSQETCYGVVITQYPNEGGFALDAARRPWLYVWYHLPMPTYMPLDQYLMPFIEEAEQDCYLECTQLGIPQMGTMNNYPAAVVIIQGIDRQTEQEVKWYQAVVSYAGRVYAIRFAAPLGTGEEAWSWKQSWPVFEKLINGITFR
jgi:hypothetical protein